MITKPYGSKLINQIITKKYFSKLPVSKQTIINLQDDDYFNAINIALGLYSPIKGFCDYKKYLSIIKNNKISNKINWTIPILLSCKLNSNIIKKNFFYKIKYKTKIVGAIYIEDTFKINKRQFIKKIFTTNDKTHPGILSLKKKKNFFIGGKIFLLQNAFPKSKYFTFPNALRKSISKQKGQITAFTTRNICHSGHLFIQKHILKKTKILYVIIIQSSYNKYDPKTIFKTYEILRNKYKLYSRVKIISFFMPTFFAGPKEAFLQATMMQNFGFNNFIVGRDHAGFKNIFKKYESQEIFNKLKSLKIKIIKTLEPLTCPKCLKIGFEGNKFCYCKKGSKFLPIDGKNIKKLLTSKNFKKVKKYLNPHVFLYLKTKFK